MNVKNILPSLKAHETSIYKRLHVAAHLAYFAAVFVEAHGAYAIAGGALFVLTAIGLALHQEVA